MISVIDYGAGNIRSVINILKHFDVDYSLVDSPAAVYSSDGIILPGVGAFGAAMKSVKSGGLDKAVLAAAEKKIPLFGICLGLQMLFEGSEESGGIEGLSLIKGCVKKLDCPDKKLPHIGWTSLESNCGTLIKDTPIDDYYYFVHSYGAHSTDDGCIACKARYGETFDAYVEKGNIFACQFHPEKSGAAGLKVIKNFIDLCADRKNGNVIKQLNFNSKN